MKMEKMYLLGGIQLKSHGITHSWQELNRIIHTQKCVTTAVNNDKGDIISIRRCSSPSEQVERIYKSLGYKTAPFTRKKT